MKEKKKPYPVCPICHKEGKWLDYKETWVCYRHPTNVYFK